MLVIRAAQMDTLKQPRLEAFVSREVARLRAEAPEVAGDATDAELWAFVRHAVERGAAHGLELDAHLSDYVSFCAWVGPDFDVEQPWAAAILAEPSLDPDGKIFRLEDYIMSQWEGARPCP